MARISTHLDAKPFQVADSADRSLPLRKWNQLGTRHAISHRSAAFIVAGELGLTGDPIESAAAWGIVYQFSGRFISVH